MNIFKQAHLLCWGAMHSPYFHNVRFVFGIDFAFERCYLWGKYGLVWKVYTHPPTIYLPYQLTDAYLAEFSDLPSRFTVADPWDIPF